MYKGKIEDTEGVIRDRKTKDRQYNSQQKKDNRTNTSKMLTRSYNQANNVIIKNGIILNIIHNIFNLYYMQNNKSNKKKGNYCLSVWSTALCIPVSHCDRICKPSWYSVMYPSITFTILVTSAAVYISCYVVLHAVVRTCVCSLVCRIYNIIQYVVQQGNY